MQIKGLTTLEVKDKISKSLVNDFEAGGSKKISHILRDNIITLFNILICPIIVLLTYFELYKALISVAGVAFLNTVIGIIQEIRAKIALDKIALIDAKKAIVIRDGTEVEINIKEIVQGEYIKIKSGDTIVADGKVVHSSYCEVDESMLTGESDYINKHEKDEVLSGSFCVSGEAVYIAEKIGAASYINKMAVETKKYRKFLSPIQMKINYIIKFMIFCGISLVVLMAMKFFINLRLNPSLANPVDTVSAISVIIVTLIPQGLVLSVTLIFMLGIIRMSKTGALIQKPHAIESMSHVNVICMDKTGTLTQNKISLKKLHPKSVSEEQCKNYLKIIAGSSLEKNKTVEAIINAFGHEEAEISDIVPFTSKRKFSGIRYKNNSDHINLFFGAYEILEQNIKNDQNTEELKREIEEFSSLGFRVLVLIKKESDNKTVLSDDLSGYDLACIILFEDDIKPEAYEILSYFDKRGISMKVISGDNPETVKSIASKLNLKDAHKTITGKKLSEHTGVDFDRVVNDTVIFARVIPEQKLQIIKSLQANGKYVAMVGDGVNDALAIKEAYLGISMGSGARITKDVAEIILTNDSFEIMPEILSHGQNIIQNIKDISKLFLFKNIFSILLIIVTQFMNFPFPFSPQQITLINFFIITLTSVYITLYSKKRADMDKNYVKEMVGYAVNAGFVTALCGIFGLIAVMLWEHNGIFLSRTYIICIISIMGINGFVFISNYNNKLSDVFKLKFFIPGLVFLIFIPLSIHLFPGVRNYFELLELTLIDWLRIAVICISGIVVSYFVCKYNLIFRFLTNTGENEKIID